MPTVKVDLVAVLREVVQPGLSALLGRGELKRLSLAWRNERRGIDHVRALVLFVTINGVQLLTATDDEAEPFDSEMARDGLEQALDTFIADVIGRRTPGSTRL